MTLDTVKQRGKQVLYISGLIALVWLFLHIKACLNPSIPDNFRQLKPGEVLQVHYNNNTHTIAVTTPTGTKTQYADNPTIHVAKGGVPFVETHPFSYRMSPFIGLGYGDTLRFHMGLQFLHLWRIGVNGSLALSPNKDKVAIIPVLGLSYNVYGNLEAFAGIDPIALAQNNGKPLSYVQAGVGVRFW